jgi:hypothetical protein
MSKRLTVEHFKKLCTERNHVLVSFDGYTGVKSTLSFKCNTCGHEWTSTAHSYKNSKTGCWGCKKKAISDFTQTRVFTEEGRKKLSLLRLGKPAWNRGVKGSVPGGGSKESTWVPTPEQRLLPGILYLVRYLDESGTHFKLGITRRTLNQRLGECLVSIIHLHTSTLGECFDLEQDCLRYCKQQGWRYSSPTTTELIHPDGLPYLLDRLTALYSAGKAGYNKLS